MVRKNKLYKHHKSKAFFYIRNFSAIFVGLVGVGVAVTVPTYIASIKTEQITIEAQFDDPEKEESEETTEENNDSEELLNHKKIQHFKLTKYC